jgi:hypothetical protein
VWLGKDQQVVGAAPRQVDPREREREREMGGGSSGTTFNGGNINLDFRLQRSPGSASSSFW